MSTQKLTTIVLVFLLGLLAVGSGCTTTTTITDVSLPAASAEPLSQGGGAAETRLTPSDAKSFRYMGKAFEKEEQTVVDLFFGGTEWRRLYEKYRNRQTRFGIHRLLMDHYKERLQDLGYKEAFRDDEVGDEPLIRNAKRKAPLYRLLFASKHPLGHDFWQKVTRRDVHGQARLF